MPDRTTHHVLGVVAGTAAAAFHARTELSDHHLLEVLGGAIGGLVGGQLPDWIEPATSPRHREAAHSVVLLCVLVATRLASAQSTCREHARAADASALQGPGARFQAGVWRALAGFLVGVQAGYVSHLVADGVTPAGLPLLFPRGT